MRDAGRGESGRLDPDRRRRLRLRDLRTAPGVLGWTAGLVVLLTALLLTFLDHLPARPLVPVAVRILGDVADARNNRMPACIAAGDHAPPGQLRYPRGSAQGGNHSSGDSWYLVSRHDASAQLGLLPTGGCRDLSTCSDWAARSLDCDLDPPGTIRDDQGRMIPDPESMEQALDAVKAGARLVVLHVDQIQPGYKVVGGPFDAMGGARQEREDLLFTLTGLLEEPIWLERLREYRYTLLPDGEGRPPLQNIKGLAGPGWVYIPLGPRWGLRDCDAEISERIPLLWRLGELVLPPVRQNPVLVSVLSVIGVDDCLRSRLAREANAAGFFVTDEPANLETDVSPPLMLRAFEGEFLAIWEMVIADEDLSSVEGRLRSFGAPAFSRLREVDTVFQVAMVHWFDGAPPDATTRRDRAALFDTLADLGFHVVVGVGGRSAGEVRSREGTLLISDLGELSGPGDLMVGIGPPTDLGWVLQCTVLRGRPFQCTLAPVLRYLGEPALFREPRLMDGAACWWRGDEIFPLFGNPLAGDLAPCYPAED